jgi:membrane peptidoglycan carboxypeptidase
VQSVLAQVDKILINQQIYHWKGLSEGTTNSEVATKKAPSFVDAVITQLLTDFGLSDETQLANAGLKVYTTLDWNLEQYLQQDASMYINGDPTKGNTVTRYWYCGLNGDAIKTACTVRPLSATDNVHNISAVAIDPYSGDVLALMGSVDYASLDKQVLGFNDLATLPVSVGSSFKPLVYATAMQMGWYPGIMLQDIPVCYPGDKITDPNTGKPIVDPSAPACAGYYVAHNYATKSFSGTAPLRVMLANSLNIPATEAQMFVGANYNVRQTFLDMIGRMGVSTCDSCDVAGIVSGARLGPTTALGTQEIPLIQEASAYGTFPTGGRHTPTRMILRIDDSQGNTRWTAPAPQLQQVMSPQTAYMMTSILTDNYARAGDFKVENPLCFTCYPNDPNDNPVPGLPQVHFGQNQEWQYIAAKTGTAEGTSGPSGIVTAGYSPYMVLAVWAGNTDPNDDLNPNIIGITGAGYVFHDVMVWAITHYKWPAQGFPIPPGLTAAQFNCTTGLAPYKGTDLNAFVNGQPHPQGNDTPVQATTGTGWCPLTYWPSGAAGGGTNLYDGWNAGPWRPDKDLILQGQLPDVS